MTAPTDKQQVVDEAMRLMSDRNIAINRIGHARGAEAVQRLPLSQQEEERIIAEMRSRREAWQKEQDSQSPFLRALGITGGDGNAR